MFNRNSIIILAVALAAGLGLVAGSKVFNRPAGEHAGNTASITWYNSPRDVADFNLAQSDGTRLVPGELRGHWTLVFLGFTHCPDVCPTTLLELAGAQQQWRSLPDSVRPRLLLVSVDPERDTPARLGEYAHAFHADTLAATGDLPALEKFTTSLGLVFAKAEGDNSADNPDDYSMDHSAGIAVLDPQGRLAGLILPPFTAATIAADLTELTKKTAP